MYAAKLLDSIRRHLKRLWHRGKMEFLQCFKFPQSSVIHSFHKDDSVRLRGNVKKKRVYLKTLSKSRLTTHSPTLFLTNYFLTNFNKVEHPPYLLNF